MYAVYALVSLQGLWIVLAFFHHRVKVKSEPLPPPLMMTPSFASLWLPLLRYLTFLELPGLIATSATPKPLRHGPGLDPSTADAPPSLKALRGPLAFSGGRLGRAFFGALVLILSVAPALALIITAFGIRLGDPAAVPDAIAAFGLYVVSCAALAGARHHTQLSPLLLPAHPVGGALAGVILLLGALRRSA